MLCSNATDRPVVLAPAGDGILFPAVDSCFAICLILQPGTLLGGHVPVFFDETAFGLAMSLGTYHALKATPHYDMQEDAMAISLGKIIEAMNTQRNGATVTTAITLGDTQWSAIWDHARGKFGYAKQIRYEKTTGPRNLIVDPAAGTVRVQRKIGGHYLNQAAYQRNLNQGTIGGQPIQI